METREENRARRRKELAEEAKFYPTPGIRISYGHLRAQAMHLLMHHEDDLRRRLTENPDLGPMERMIEIIASQSASLGIYNLLANIEHMTVSLMAQQWSKEEKELNGFRDKEADALWDAVYSVCSVEDAEEIARRLEARLADLLSEQTAEEGESDERVPSE